MYYGIWKVFIFACASVALADKDDVGPKQKVRWSLRTQFCQPDSLILCLKVCAPVPTFGGDGMDKHFTVDG